MKDKQLFFRRDELPYAEEAARITNEVLYALRDRRSKNPSDLMYVLGPAVVRQMFDSKMCKRMWVCVVKYHPAVCTLNTRSEEERHGRRE